MKQVKSTWSANFRKRLRYLRFFALFCRREHFRSQGGSGWKKQRFHTKTPVPDPRSPVPKNTKNKKKLEIFYYICYNIIEEL